MILKQIGVAAAVAGFAVAAALGIWNMVDRRFTEMREEMRAGFARVDARLDATNTRLDALAADVHMLVGRQQERDRAPADD